MKRKKPPKQQVEDIESYDQEDDLDDWDRKRKDSGVRRHRWERSDKKDEDE